MHFNKTNHFYLHHALGTHICPLHGPHLAFHEGQEPEKSSKNMILSDGSSFHDGLVDWFEHLGKSMQWTLAPADRAHPLLPRIRAEHVKRRRFSRRLAQSPLAPESTWWLAQTLQKHWFGRSRAPTPYKNNGLGATGRRGEFKNKKKSSRFF